MKKLWAVYAEAFQKGQLSKETEYHTEGVDETNVYLASELLEKILSFATELRPGDILTNWKKE